MQAKRPRRHSFGENYSRDTLGAHPYLRWLVYEHAEPPVDFDGALVKIANPKSNDTIVDYGFGSGYFLYSLASSYGLTGRLIGVDPAPEQFEYAGLWRNALKDWEEFKEKVDVIPATMEEVEFPPDFEADLQTCNYAFYKLKRRDQEHVIEKIKAIMRKPDPNVPGDIGGRFMVATSGWHNKSEHRKLEQANASYLTNLTNTITAHPRRMNRNFTTERAFKWLPRHFEVVRHIPLAAEITIVEGGEERRELIYPNMMFYGTEMGQSRDVDTYYLSQSTMTDQYDPPPTGAQLQSVMEAVTMKKVEERIRRYGFFVDRIVRDAFECWGPKNPAEPIGEVQIRSLGELALNSDS